MATMAMDARATRAGDHRFFLWMAVAMAALNVAAFAMQFAMGRSTFGAPPLVHFHALVFFGWVTIYLLQNVLISTGSVRLHRRLGWVAAGWAAMIVVVGIATTTVMVRAGRAPFFFMPGYFLVMNSLAVLTFGGLLTAAIRLRRRTEWHRRLMACAMAAIMGPAFGRLLPMPFMIPWAAWGVFVALLLFPLAGVFHDRRRHGAVHPAWWWGIGVLTASQVAMGVIASSAVGAALYGWATAGSAAAAIPALAYPPFPPRP